MKYTIKVSIKGEVREIVKDLPIHESSGPAKILTAAKDSLATEPGSPVLLSVTRTKKPREVA